MIVNYRVWLKDRENPKSRMQFCVVKFHVNDILEKAHDLIMENSDHEWECYRIDFISISDFVL